MAVDRVALVVRATREVAEQVAGAADAMFTALEAIEEMSEIEDDAGPQSGIFRGPGTPSSGSKSTDSEKIEALRRLVSEALPYVARHADIHTATRWLERADALGCRR